MSVMKTPRTRRTLASWAAALLGSSFFLLGHATAQPVPAASPILGEVMTRGPVHEAFAGVITANPEPGRIVDTAPPTPIEEVPPDQRLVGENVTWIPGYWMWDEERSDYLWVSGIWRSLPPGRQWLPGNWAEMQGRFQWTSGYWEDGENSRVSYLPQPPRSQEAGPNIEAASNDQTWIPGNWVWRDDRYLWRPGYWVAARDGWCWTPAYYRWTRQGYVYVDGFWDTSVAERGVLFAPVHFTPEEIARPGFSYTPTTAVSRSVFTHHLFIRPQDEHYYFGDYYEPLYQQRGFLTAFSFNSSRRGYDPIEAHSRWENRNVRDWSRQRQEYYEYRRDHQEARPPRTWSALEARPEADRDRGDFGVAERYDRLISNGGVKNPRFQAVPPADRAKLIAQRQQLRKYAQEHQQLEAREIKPKPPTQSKKGAAPVAAERPRIALQRSPIAARKFTKQNPNGSGPPRLQPRTAEAGGKANAPIARAANPQPQKVAVKQAQPQRPQAPQQKPQAKPQVRPQPRPAQPKPKPQAQPKPKPQGPKQQKQTR
jgi:WXXGXW repeat (2 copies)